MRILFINSIQMFGGGEMWMLRTLTGLRKQGHRVYLICRPGTELEKRALALNIPVYTIKMRGDFGPLSIFRTWRFIRKNKVRIMLANMDKELRFGGIAAKLAGNCAVIPRRGIDYPLKNKIQYRLSWGKIADCALANSQATKKALLRNAPWLRPDKVKVVYNGIEPEKFMGPADHDFRAEWKIPKDDFVFGFVGQLDERKGLHTLLPAFAEMVKKYKAHLVLIGEGKMDREIKAFTRDNGLDAFIHLAGFVADVENVMKAIDCLLLPSLWEGFGIVLIEAMAAGKSAITTNVSSMPEIVVHRETGLVVPVQDQKALQQAMSEIVSNPELAQQWGQNGRQRVLEKFTQQKMLQELEKLFAGLIIKD